MTPTTLTVGDLTLGLRPMRPCRHGRGQCDWSGDDCYVRSSAVRTVRTAAEFRGMDGPTFYETVGELLRTAIDDAPLRLIAFPQEDPDLVAAFVIGIPGDPPILHYLHVRSAFCKVGVAEALALASLDIRRDRIAAFTFPTAALDSLCRSPRWHLTYRQMGGAR